MASPGAISSPGARSDSSGCGRRWQQNRLVLPVSQIEHKGGMRSLMHVQPCGRVRGVGDNDVEQKFAGNDVLGFLRANACLQPWHGADIIPGVLLAGYPERCAARWYWWIVAPTLFASISPEAGPRPVAFCGAARKIGASTSWENGCLGSGRILIRLPVEPRTSASCRRAGRRCARTAPGRAGAACAARPRRPGPGRRSPGVRAGSRDGRSCR
jgi:hypothetical protein